MRFSASVTMLFGELPLLDRFAAVRAAGFEGVEIQTLAVAAPAVMARAAADAGTPVVLVNVPTGDYSTGGPGLSGVPGREELFRAEVLRALEAAELLDARFVHLGPSRIPETVEREACLATYCQNLEMAVMLARGSGRELLIEAMNRVEAPTALLSDVEDAAALIRAGFLGRVGLQFDVYHLAMNGRDPVAAFNAHADLVRHVQFADAPGRHEPGTGAVDFAAIFGTIRQSGYSGWCGAEYHPSRETSRTLDWLGHFAKAGET